MKKVDLKDKIDVAYYRKTGNSGGWDVFLSMIYKSSQEEVARAFGVTLSTSQRWHKEFKQTQVA